LRDYLKAHERFIHAALDGEFGELPWGEVADFHAKQVARMQHERLVHLLVTLFMGFFLIAAVGLALVRPTLPVAVLIALLFALETAYIWHYFRLENGVQRWYHLANRLDERAGRAGADYASGEVMFFGGRSIIRQVKKPGNRKGR